MVLLKTLVEEARREQREKTKKKRKRKKVKNRYSVKKDKVRKSTEKTLTGIKNLYKYKNKEKYVYIYKIDNEHYKNENIWVLREIIKQKGYPWEIDNYYYVRKTVKELDTNIYELMYKEY